MTDSANIVEIFDSVQGEGPYVGYKQLFIRFSDCNLGCKYCDTDYKSCNGKDYTVEELIKIIKKHPECHSVSLTGGEPLLHTEFLKDFLPNCPLPVYLETNSTMPENLREIVDYIDYIAADIKLPSCSGLKELWDRHESFFSIASKKDMFIKIVFDENITDEEIEHCCVLASKYMMEITLQPVMNEAEILVPNRFIKEVHNKFLKKYKKVRLIPQIHKFLNIK